MPREDTNRPPAPEVEGRIVSNGRTESGQLRPPRLESGARREYRPVGELASKPLGSNVNVFIRCTLRAQRDEPLTRRAERVAAVIGAPEFARVMGARWTRPTASASADAPEPACALADLRAWSPAPTSDDVAYRLSRWNGRDGASRCDLICTLWLESTEPDQLLLRFARRTFPGDGPDGLSLFAAWLQAATGAEPEIGDVDRHGMSRSLAAK